MSKTNTLSKRKRRKARKERKIKDKAQIKGGMPGQTPRE